MTAAVVPINPRHWQEMLWEDQTLWDGLGALVLAELDERVWNVMDREDPREQTLLLALKHGYADALEGYVANLEATDREMAQPPSGKRKAWVLDYPTDILLGNSEDAIATAVLPRVQVEETQELPLQPEPEKRRRRKNATLTPRSHP